MVTNIQRSTAISYNSLHNGQIYYIIRQKKRSFPIFWEYLGPNTKKFIVITIYLLFLSKIKRPRLWKTITMKNQSQPING